MGVSLVLSAVLGGLSGAVGMVAAKRRWDDPIHVRKNYRGQDVIAAAGIVLVLPLLVGTVVAYLAAGADQVATAMLAAGAAMAVFGFIDDVYGDRHAGGLIGHARALMHGTLTTGMLKAGGGALLGLAVAYYIGWRGGWIVVAGSVVALSSNLANLFDLRPGRTIKVWFIGTAVLALSSHLGSGRAVLAALAGGVAVFLVFDLREEVMLGDTGAGLLGVVLGVGAIAVLSRLQLVIVAVLFLGLTLLSEAVSFSRIIEASRPLRWLDGLGREPDD